jgi:hypothetical protein
VAVEAPLAARLQRRHDVARDERQQVDEERARAGHARAVEERGDEVRERDERGAEQHEEQQHHGGVRVRERVRAHGRHQHGGQRQRACVTVPREPQRPPGLTKLRG